MTLRQQVFNAPGTWTWPGGISYVDVFLVGGGGGAALRTNPFPAPSGGPVTDYYGGGGGGIRYEVGVPVSAPVPVTVGAGGAAQPLAPAAANPGGDSSFGPVVVGGGGGANLNAPPNGGGGGAKNNRNGNGGVGGLYGSSTETAPGNAGAPGGRMAVETYSSLPRTFTVTPSFEGFFELGAGFDGYGTAGLANPTSPANLWVAYGNLTNNMGGGGWKDVSSAQNGTSGVVIVRWFE